MKRALIDKLAFVEIRNRKLMVTWETGKDVWMIPGGKRDKGETDLKTLARELKEELSVDFILETAELIGIYEGSAHGKPEGTWLRITCYLGKTSGKVKLNPPIERIGWIDSKEKLVSEVGTKILTDLKIKNLID